MENHFVRSLQRALETAAAEAEPHRDTTHVRDPAHPEVDRVKCALSSGDYELDGHLIAHALADALEDALEDALLDHSRGEPDDGTRQIN